MSYEVVVAQEPWDRFWNYVDLTDNEVAAFGYIKPDPEGFMFVDDLFLVPQEVTGASVEFMEEGLPYAVDKAEKDGRLEDLRFCIHSHVNFGASWSADDDEMIEKVGSTGTPWFVSAIFNKRRETACRLDVFKSNEIPGLAFSNLKLDILCEPVDDPARDEAQAELKEFLRKAKPVPPKHKGKGTTGGRGYQIVSKAWDSDDDEVGERGNNGHRRIMSPAALEAELESKHENYEFALATRARARKNKWTPVIEDAWTIAYYDDSGQYQGSIPIDLCEDDDEWSAMESYYDAMNAAENNK
jgi:hypothetical protein